MNKEVIEAMAWIIEAGHNKLDEPLVTVHELLNLRYKCKECKGSGKAIIGAADFANIKNSAIIKNIQCPSCKGTGEGERMLVILDPDQKIPENLYKYTDKELKVLTTERLALKQGYSDGQEDMLKAGWKKVIG